jgi:cation diffusion facilitator CzcD-associated flavoprotein CzcO
VTSAVWHEDSREWAVEVEGRPAISCNILINAGGILNDYKFPDIPNLASFKGPVLHSAAWDSSVSLRDKRVAIIGAGASAMQVLPAIREECRSVDVYIRTPSWISPPVDSTTEAGGNPAYTPSQMAQWRDDDEFALRERKRFESSFNGPFRTFLKNSAEQKEMRARFEAYMRSQIRDAELQERLIPDFEAGCRRVNPSRTYLEALQAPNVQPIFDHVDSIDPQGVVAGGQLHEADVLVCATGFDTSFIPRFPIVGRAGVSLAELWKDDAVSYMGTAVSGFPNYLIFLGPNTPISNGSLIGKANCP